jgi:hypothetical protein
MEVQQPGVQQPGLAPPGTQKPSNWLKGVATGILVAVAAAWIYDQVKANFPALNLRPLWVTAPSTKDVIEPPAGKPIHVDSEKKPEAPPRVVTRIVVPNLVGMDVETAFRILEGLGLQVRRQDGGDRATAGWVESQTPGAQQLADAGGTVSLGVKVPEAWSQEGQAPPQTLVQVAPPTPVAPPVGVAPSYPQRIVVAPVPFPAPYHRPYLRAPGPQFPAQRPLAVPYDRTRSYDPNPRHRTYSNPSYHQPITHSPGLQSPYRAPSPQRPYQRQYSPQYRPQSRPQFRPQPNYQPRPQYRLQPSYRPQPQYRPPVYQPRPQYRQEYRQPTSPQYQQRRPQYQPKPYSPNRTYAPSPHNSYRSAPPRTSRPGRPPGSYRRHGS